MTQCHDAAGVVRRLRIAFLTPEFPTETDDSGGLSSYLRRMCHSLLEAGHEPEVFTISTQSPETIEYEGVRVQRISPAAQAPELWQRLLGRMPLRPFNFRIAARMCEAHALAQALEARHHQAPFEIVQSPNFGLSGVYIQQRPGRVHIVRCSQPAALYAHAESTLLGGIRAGFTGPDDLISDHVERALFRRAQAVYAPSDFVASFYRRRFGVPVATIRPPFVFQDALGEPPPGLPTKFFAFVGKADRVKGADILARAAAVAIRVAPDLRIVCAGSVDFLAAARRARVPTTNLSWIGPLKKSALYAFERRAVAVVAPSRYDNLPNTVIEALMLGVPVIGSRGASIDELVEDGQTGELVPINDENALADALVRAWRGEARWKNRREAPAKLAMLAPELCLAQFFKLVSSVLTIGP